MTSLNASANGQSEMIKNQNANALMQGIPENQYVPQTMKRSERQPESSSCNMHIHDPLKVRNEDKHAQMGRRRIENTNSKSRRG